MTGFAALHPSYGDGEAVGQLTRVRSSIHEADAGHPIDGRRPIRDVYGNLGTFHLLELDKRGPLRRVVADGFNGKRHPPVLRACIVDRAEDRTQPLAIDERVGEFLNRPLTGDWPYVWLDATYLKVRQGGRIVPVAAIIAVAANTEGRREIIG